MPLALSENQNCLVMLPNVPWGAKLPPGWEVVDAVENIESGSRRIEYQTPALLFQGTHGTSLPHL